ncbi:MAG: hypothetical protein A4E69_01350 [Syntrophus sp. PtaB.Bin138]|nr:MAG: hypothetical protein A4E69_01350 [Syntrophus sp. PtaB.Bin138]
MIRKSLRKGNLGLVGSVWAACLLLWVAGPITGEAKADHSPLNKTNYDYHFTILNKTGEPIQLLFWGAKGWMDYTNPIKVFTGKSTSQASAFFEPCWLQGGGNNIDEALATHCAGARGGLDSPRSKTAQFYLNQNNPAFSANEGAVTVTTKNADWPIKRQGFKYLKPQFYPSHPYAFMTEYYGNQCDLFAVVLKNDDTSKHFIWAGKTLSRQKNGRGEEVWASTCRSIFYSYYYEYAYDSFLFEPYGDWYVNTGGGSDDLLWAMLAGIGYKQLRVLNNNGMLLDVFRHIAPEKFWQTPKDSNRDLTDTYLAPLEMRNVLNYLYESGYWYAGKQDNPLRWYGIPWKDHLGNTKYSDPLSRQQDYRDKDGFNQRASISNGLFWLYAARLLNAPELFELTQHDSDICRKTIENQFDLFFKSHKKLYVCQKNVLPDPPSGRKIDRIGLIEDGAHFPNKAYLKNPETETPGWEKAKDLQNQKPDDRFTWTYNTGVVLAALGESYLVDPTPAKAKRYLINEGVELANAALDKLSWQKADCAAAPPGVICEIETEMRDFAITDSNIANSIIIFKGLFALFIGDYAQALYRALADGNVAAADLEKAVKCYQRISGVMRGTSNFLWDKWGDKPIAAWIYPDYKPIPLPGNEYNLYKQNEITEGSAAAAHITAGRLARMDADLRVLGIIKNADEYLIYPILRDDTE